MSKGEYERGKVGIDHQPEAAQTPSSTLAPAVAEVRAILARGRPEPHVIALSIERDASARDQILTLLHQALGNSFVHQVVAALESPRGASAPVETPTWARARRCASRETLSLAAAHITRSVMTTLKTEARKLSR